MIFKSTNFDDINRYYKATYVKFKETGDKLFYIRNVSPTSVTGCDEDGTEFELFLNDEYPYEVDYILPRKSFFQMGKRACLLQRIPAKQYQRGLSNSNTRVNALGKTGSVNAVELTFDVLTEFVNKQAFPSLSKAVLNKAKDHSVVLSPRFAYVPDMKAIFADAILVAEVNPEDKLVVVRHPIFKPELLELAADTEFKVA